MDDFSYRRGVALITGGSGGIGREVCRLMAERGSDVALTYNRNGDAAQSAVADVVAAGRRGVAYRVDLVDAAAVGSLVDTLVHRFAGIHTVIHAAGPHVPQRYLSCVTPGLMRERLDQEAAALFNVLSPALMSLREAGGTIVAVTTAA